MANENHTYMALEIKSHLSKENSGILGAKREALACSEIEINCMLNQYHNPLLAKASTAVVVNVYRGAIISINGAKYKVR